MKLGGRYRGWVSAVAQHPAGDVPAVVLLPHRIVPTRRPASGRGSTIRRDIRARSPAIEPRSELGTPAVHRGDRERRNQRSGLLGTSA